ncbi:MAG: hypothetical protein AAFO07_08960 [Bacteroidota bacterium]
MIDLLLQADTTSVGYKIGYQIGSWLPFMIIVLIVGMIIYRRYNFNRKGE